MHLDKKMKIITGGVSKNGLDISFDKVNSQKALTGLILQACLF
jgi:hypothetical protein